MSQKVARGAEAKKLLEAAITNEQTTRQRVDDLEQWAMAFTRLTFWGRLKWLIRGR